MSALDWNESVNDDQSRDYDAKLPGGITLTVWCSRTGEWVWQMMLGEYQIGRHPRKEPGHTEPSTAKLAAETAARQYADAIRAALPLTIATVITSPRFLAGEVYAEATIDGWVWQYKASTTGRGEPVLLWRCRHEKHAWDGQDATWHADQIGLADLLRPCTEVEAES